MPPCPGNARYPASPAGDLVQLPKAPVPRLRFLLETVAARVLPGDPLIGAALGRLSSGRLQ